MLGVEFRAIGLLMTFTVLGISWVQGMVCWNSCTSCSGLEFGGRPGASGQVDLMMTIATTEKNARKTHNNDTRPSTALHGLRKHSEKHDKE